jgi:hypothetical protein
MRKKLVIWAMVALVALVTVTPALAAGNGHEGNGGSHQQFFSVLGTITAIGADTITVEVVDGSRLVWSCVDEDDELTVNVTGSTLYYERTADGLDPIEFGDVEVGNTTNIHGTVAEDGDFTAFTADWVTVLP